MKLLVAEDSGTMRLIMGGMLSQIGAGKWDVAYAEDGQEALQLIGLGGFDVVLLDVHMPNMDGLQFLRSPEAQRAISSGTVILLVSSDSSQETINAALCLGARGNISKPFSRHKLEMALSEAQGPI